MLSPAPGVERVRRAGVVGSPISHSLSPVLHGAAYAALGLTSWSFTAEDVPAGALRGHVDRLPADWVGLSVTMPLKEEALALATSASQVARLAGAANTLVHRDDGWFADNTDVHGAARALAEAGLRDPVHATVVGGGATARSTVLALHAAGVRSVTFLVRAGLRAQTRDLVEHLGLDCRVQPLSGGVVTLDAALTDVVVGTLPPTADPPALRPSAGAAAPVVMDVVYAPWPSRFAQAVRDATGGAVPVVRGTDMLLHQAVRQVELMTGHDGPVPAMRAALETEGTGTA